ncbi:Oidioi.mRNA.OKI2018_I69.chr1.g3198.t1.cds [Oikopleura dioica]|uniref:Oidioi.mRNA.OKI2018_I69.chr1.g3198.t1.cds n=1 Tax=Oikopleura dioica TaxID=34765 RepID=A0ABN7ST93_OIKDI|nr:Oidioi.mRNA.OKI2018_I69.chr1.g3198.t1.cds [Oikopleura dioica]
MKFSNFFIPAVFAQQYSWENLVNIDDPRSCIICDEQGAPEDVYLKCQTTGLSPSFFAKLKNILTHLKGAIKQCGKYQICEFTERRNNGQVQIHSQCKQKRSCKIEAKHNKTQCKKNGQRDRNGVLVSSTCRQCFPSALIFTQVLGMLETGSYPHTMFDTNFDTVFLA